MKRSPSRGTSRQDSMKPIFCARRMRNTLSLALLLIVAALAASAARRPRYGGTLTVELACRVTSLDPAQPQATVEDQLAQDRLLTLISDRLITLGDHGQPQPSLAWDWQRSGNDD